MNEEKKPDGWDIGFEIAGAAFDILGTLILEGAVNLVGFLLHLL